MPTFDRASTVRISGIVEYWVELLPSVELTGSSKRTRQPNAESGDRTPSKENNNENTTARNLSNSLRNEAGYAAYRRQVTISPVIVDVLQLDKALVNVTNPPPTSGKSIISLL